MTAVSRKDVEERLNSGLRGQWYIVAKSSQIQPGGVFAARALRQRLVLWRTAEGVLRCVEDYCPHRGAPLSRGVVVGEHVACAYHGVQIDGSGTVARVPALRGCLLEGRKELTSYVVEEHRDGVFCWFPSADKAEPEPISLPYEFAGDDYAMFLTTSVWEQNYRYAMENIADPMHGPYLHGDTFTLSEGTREDTVKLSKVDAGFTVARVQQQGENFDWAEVIVESNAPHCRVDIPYPRAGGPGGIMRVVAFLTPIDERNTRIFFWRCRKVSGLEREAWRFLFRTTFEARHWAVLEQDRAILSAMPADARQRERLYQHDIGITRLRQILSRRARAQLEAEQAIASERNAARRRPTETAAASSGA